MPQARRKLSPHGTVARYRLELRTPGVEPCDRCRAANADKAAATRANADAKARRDAMHAVDGGGPGDMGEDTNVDTPSVPAGPGPVERAVQADIDAIPVAEQVRFHASLTQVALAAAREMDAATSSTARTAARKDVFEVLKSLGAREGTDGAHDPLALALSDLGTPLPGLSDVSA